MIKKISLQHALFLFVLGLYVFCVLIPALRPGMYVDGVTYAAIAKNMAMGLGSIWDPYYSQTLFTHFYEHPSLALYFQSLFFKLFGQSYLVERFYDLCVWAVSLSVALTLWMQSCRRDLFAISYFLFIWILIPLNYTIVNDNLLECTANCITLIASFFLLSPALFDQSLMRRAAKVLLAAGFMVIGFFVNGPTAFFPLAIPILNVLTTRRSTLTIAFLETFSLLMIVVLSVLTIFYFVPAAQHNIEEYFHTQLFASITGTRNMAYIGWDHLNILLLMLRNVWPATVIAGLLCYLGYRLSGRLSRSASDLERKKGWLYFVIALAASLPVIVSHRQAFHYVAQMSPFYALFLATITYPRVVKLYEALKAKFSKRMKSVISASGVIFLFVSFGVAVFLAGTPREHGPMLEDVHKLVSFLPQKSIVSASSAVYGSMDTSSYFARYSLISLKNKGHERYYLTLKSQHAPKGYHWYPAHLQYFKLWEK